MPGCSNRSVWIIMGIATLVSFVVILVVCVAYVVGSATPSTRDDAPTRTYYVAAREIVWNYAPDVDETHYPPSHSSFIDQQLSESTDPPRLGRSYLKAVFRQYTDDSFQTESQRPEWLGILGPVIKAEVGDVIKVHFFNNASIPVSMHPHGLSYEKSDEGAYYQDNSTLEDKADDEIPPNGTFVYTWTLPESNSPASSDSDCLTMAYHSHRKADSDIHTGLIGPLVVCKKGTLEKYEEKEEKTVFLLFLIFDENESWYLERNIERKLSSTEQTQTVVEELKDDEEFQESNRMYTINGRSFGTLGGLEFCVGDDIEWRLIGMGNEIDVHSVTFQGHLVKLNGHRTDVISLVPAKFTNVNMVARYEGQWKILSETGSEFLAGMKAQFIIRKCSSSIVNDSFVVPDHSRKYFIAAEEIQWNYAPSNLNKFNNKELTSDEHAAVFFEQQSNRIGGSYKKAVYRSYTDANFTNRNPRNEEEEHLGLLGPVIRIEVGETITLIFKNKASRPYSIFSPAVEIFDENGTSVRSHGVKVEAGSSVVLYWYVPDYLGPSEVDPQCLTWRYYSDVDVLKDAYSGLNGILLTCKKQSLQNGRQRNVDREFSLIFAVMDENESNYIDENILTYCSNPQTVDKEDEDFQESNKMHSINGLMYGNLEGLDMVYNTNVSWHIVAFGKETDLHTAYFHGETFLQHGMYRDSFVLLPNMHYTVLMRADNPGEWELECKTVDHYQAGMRAKYRINAADGTNLTEEGNVRTYYIAAMEEEWNYATHSHHLITGELLTENEESKTFVERGDERIGSVYKKVMYQQYADPEFTQLIAKPSHLGILGPFIKAEVGERIRIVFKNMAQNHSFSIRLQGLVAVSEWVAAQSNEIVTYTWRVPERSGPGNSEFNCTSWAYYSDVDVTRDVNSGLVGPLVICRKGILGNTGARNDVDREFSLLFTVFDENLSWYLHENINNYCQKPESVDVENEDFQESNLLHAINGRIYGSLEGLEANKGDRVAWYFIGLGNEVDVHTAHFHGVTFVRWNEGKRRSDVLELFPGVYETVEMMADNPGRWLLHCHVDDHVKAGMNALFTIKH
ncbi:hephaestin-like protein [Centruroides vittatus]|uniref:hephaestin-like protein n=1 Tax=Centruroides vittatus TaxID=120091 RepID=UPI00351086E4